MKKLWWYSFGICSMLSLIASVVREPWTGTGADIAVFGVLVVSSAFSGLVIAAVITAIALVFRKALHASD